MSSSIRTKLHILMDVLGAILLTVCIAFVGGMAYIVWKFIV